MGMRLISLVASLFISSMLVPASMLADPEPESTNCGC